MSTALTPKPQAARETATTTQPSWAALTVILAGIFICTLDFFIVNVALPSTQAELHASPSQIQFVVAGYGLALAAGLITAGRLGDLLGRRRMFSMGVALFTAASAACGLAPTATFLVAARVVQGAAAAMLMPQVLAIINTVYTGAHRNRAYNAYGLAIGFGAVFGQLIGGALIKADVAGLGWRSIFLINVPIGLAAVALIPRLVPESRATIRARLDPTGTILVSLGLVAIVLPLVQGQQQGWPEWTWLSLAVSLPLLTGFVLHQRRLGARGGSPLVNLAVFRQQAFSAGTTINLVYSMTTASFFLVLALYLQDGRGLSALGSGLMVLPTGIGYFLTSSRSGQVAARLGRQVVTVGALTVATGYGLLAVTAVAPSTHGIGWLIPGLAVAGAGMGLVMTPLPAIVLADVQPDQAASASGVLSTAQQAGGAMGVAVIGVVFYHALGGNPLPASFSHAFTLGLDVLLGLNLVVAALAQLLPRPTTP
jgi:EmrB/QacA subfamily drug resistance transporter